MSDFIMIVGPIVDWWLDNFCENIENDDEGEE